MEKYDFAEVGCLYSKGVKFNKDGEFQQPKIITKWMPAMVVNIDYLTASIIFVMLTLDLEYQLVNYKFGDIDTYWRRLNKSENFSECHDSENAKWRLLIGAINFCPQYLGDK